MPTRKEPAVSAEAAGTRIELGGEFAGRWFAADLDITIADWRLLGKDEFETSLEVLGRVVTDWNFVDRAGAPLPVTPEGWAGLPVRLLRAILPAYVSAVKADTSLPFVSSKR